MLKIRPLLATTARLCQVWHLELKRNQPTTHRVLQGGTQLKECITLYLAPSSTTANFELYVTVPAPAAAQVLFSGTPSSLRHHGLASSLHLGRRILET